MISRKPKDPRVPLRNYIWGSFIVLLACLLSTAIVLSNAYLNREKERASIYQGQLKQFFAFNYRLMTEEMWTKSYESIAGRVGEIAKQLGDAKYQVILMGPEGKCVFRFQNGQEVKLCEAPTSFTRFQGASASTATTRPLWELDASAGEYHHFAPLYVGYVLQGFMFVAMSDPFGFLHGNDLFVASRIFLPGILIVLGIWGVWLAISRRWILRPYLSRLVDLEKKQALGDLAIQVAHDIHSPLATLMSVIQNRHELPPDETRLLRAAGSRIQHIADDLLVKYKKERSVPEPEFCFPAAAIHSIVAEKMAILGDSSLQIQVSIDPRIATSGVPMTCTALSRVLSNLMDNSIDAASGGESGFINVELVKGQSDHARIVIRDNGTGMAPEILEKVRSVGGTYGKANGAGMGFQHANKTLQNSGGKLSINSTAGLGTEVIIEVPWTTSPTWSIEALAFPRDVRIVVLDDVESVHLLWRKKLLGWDVVCLSRTEEFDVAKYPPSQCRYIFDFEVAGSPETGLDVIRRCGLGSNAILSTSYYNESDIQLQAHKLNTKLLPKSLIPYVLVQTLPGVLDGQRALGSNAPDLVLIDDQEIVHQMWRYEALLAGKKVETFFDEQAFLTRGIPLSTSVYIDKNLSDEESGVEVARRLSAIGYENLYLATGEEPSVFRGLTFIKGVIGKQFQKDGTTGCST